MLLPLHFIHRHIPLLLVYAAIQAWSVMQPLLSDSNETSEWKVQQWGRLNQVLADLVEDIAYGMRTKVRACSDVRWLLLSKHELEYDWKPGTVVNVIFLLSLLNHMEVLHVTSSYIKNVLLAATELIQTKSTCLITEYKDTVTSLMYRLQDHHMESVIYSLLNDLVAEVNTIELDEFFSSLALSMNVSIFTDVERAPLGYQQYLIAATHGRLAEVKQLAPAHPATTLDALWRAVTHNQIEVVKYIMSTQGRIITGGARFFLIRTASARGRSTILDYLISLSPPSQYHTFLPSAWENAFDAETCLTLLKYSPPTNVWFSSAPKELLHEVIRELDLTTVDSLAYVDHPVLIRMLLLGGAQGYTNSIALINACRKKDVCKTRLLIQAGFDVNYVDREQNSFNNPLHAAVGSWPDVSVQQHLEVVGLLLAHGANPNLCERYDGVYYIPLELVVFMTMSTQDFTLGSALCKLLVKHGAEVKDPSIAEYVFKRMGPVESGPCYAIGRRCLILLEELGAKLTRKMKRDCQGKLSHKVI